MVFLIGANQYSHYYRIIREVSLHVKRERVRVEKD